MSFFSHCLWKVCRYISITSFLIRKLNVYFSSFALLIMNTRSVWCNEFEIYAVFCVIWTPNVGYSTLILLLMNICTAWCIYLHFHLIDMKVARFLCYLVCYFSYWWYRFGFPIPSSNHLLILQVCFYQSRQSYHEKHPIVSTYCSLFIHTASISFFDISRITLDKFANG